MATKHLISFGCIPDEVDVRDYKISRASIKQQSFPKTFECEKTMKVKHQGSVGSCTAHALSSIFEYHYTDNVKLSTNFLYGIHYQLYNSQGPGLRLREALKIASKYGDPEEKLCKGNNEVEKVYSIAETAFNNKEVMKNAEKYKIKEYARLTKDDDIKFSLINYGPVLASIVWYEQNETNKNGVLIKGKTADSHHAIVIYGWNAQGWLCQNSWGALWGKRGRFILPFNYGIVDAYSIIPNNAEASEIKKPIQNSFVDSIYKAVNSVINLYKKNK